MKPYVDATESPARRRRRILIAVGLAFFCLFYGVVYAFLTPYLLPVVAAPAILLALIVVWALPDSPNPPTRPMEAFFFALVVAYVVWPNYLALSLPGLPWITAVRVTQTPFTLLLAVCASTSAEFRQRLSESVKAAPLVWVLFLVFIVMEFLSIALSDQKSESFQKFVLSQINWTFAFIGAAYLFRKPGRADLMSKLLWGVAMIIGLMAVAEHHARHILWAGHIPRFLQINDPNVVAIMGLQTRAFTNVYRAKATFTTALGMSEFLALAIPFVIHHMLTARSIVVKSLASVSVPFLLYAILISGARLGVVGFGVSILIYALTWGIQRWRRNHLDLIGPAVVLSYPALFAVAVGASFMIGKIRKSVWGGGGAAASSTAARLAQWHLGIPKILSHPLGHGIGRGGAALGYLDPSGILTIDSYYLDILMDYGPLGFMIYFGMIASGIYYAFRWMPTRGDEDTELSLLTPAGICLATFFVTKAVFSNPDNHWLAFMVLGMVCALVYRSRQERGEQKPVAASSAFGITAMAAE